MLSLLIYIFIKEFYQKYAVGLTILCLPPPSMTYANIYQRYLLSGDIQNEIIQLYKIEL